MKKAQVEISFNWIFILIIGGSFLLFFVIIGKNITSDAGKETDIKITERFKTILAASERNDNSVDKSKAPMNIELKFFCEGDDLYYKILDSKADPTVLSTNTIYSPKIIGASKVTSWSIKYSAPYAITTTLLLSDEKTMYLFEKDGALAEKTYNQIPDEFTKLLLTKEEIEQYADEGFRKYIIITTSNINLINPKLKQKATMLKILGSMDVGEINFIKYGGPGLNGRNTISTKAYVSKEMLVGGIISGSPSLYNCTRNKILKKTRIITQIYKKRADLIGEDYPTNDRCSIYYGSGILNSFLDKILHVSIDEFDKEYSNYYNAINSVKSINGEILRTSCPLIY